MTEQQLTKTQLSDRLGGLIIKYVLTTHRTYHRGDSTDKGGFCDFWFSNFNSVLQQQYTPDDWKSLPADHLVDPQVQTAYLTLESMILSHIDRIDASTPKSD